MSDLNTVALAYAAALWRFYRGECHDEPKPPQSLSWGQAEALARQVHCEFMRGQMISAAKRVLKGAA